MSRPSGYYFVKLLGCSGWAPARYDEGVHFPWQLIGCTVSYKDNQLHEIGERIAVPKRSVLTRK